MTSDEQFSRNLVLGVVWHEVQRRGVHVQSLPEPQPLNDDNEQLLVKMTELIRLIGEKLDQEPEFNRMVDHFTRVADRKGFQNILDTFFAKDIKWIDIISLICLVAKSFAKVMLVELGSATVSWMLDDLIEKLTQWIFIHGGWVNIDLSSYTQNAASFTSLMSPSSGLLLITGLLLGGYIFWRLYRCA